MLVFYGYGLWCSPEWCFWKSNPLSTTEGLRSHFAHHKTCCCEAVSELVFWRWHQMRHISRPRYKVISVFIALGKRGLREAVTQVVQLQKKCTAHVRRCEKKRVAGIQSKFAFWAVCEHLVGLSRLLAPIRVVARVVPRTRNPHWCASLCFYAYILCVCENSGEVGTRSAIYKLATLFFSGMSPIWSPLTPFMSSQRAPHLFCRSFFSAARPSTPSRPLTKGSENCGREFENEKLRMTAVSH